MSSVEQPQERVQFAVSGDDGEDVFERLSTLARPDFPRAGRKQAAPWSRVALRLLAAHAHRASGSEWVVVRGRRVSRPLRPGEPEGTTSLKVDLHLSSADAARLVALEEGGLASSPAAILRMAVHWLAQLAAQLERGGELRQRSEQGSFEPLDLIELCAEGAVVPPEVQVHAPLLGGALEEGDARAPVECIIPKQAEMFVGILLATGALNRYLALRVDDVTRDAEQIALSAPAVEQTQLMEAASIAWEKKLNLADELARFRGTCGGESIDPELRAAFFSDELDSGLYQRNWFSSKAKHRELAELAFDVLADYLEQRCRRLRPRPDPDRPADSPQSREGVGAAETCQTRWRNWTRSRRLPDGTYEAGAPIEWSAVVYHWLRTPARSHAALVAHELQTLLLDLFGARIGRHLGVLADGCVQFNQLYYGRAFAPGNGGMEQSLEHYPLEQLLTQLGRTSSATMSADEGSSIARLIYLYLTLLRVARPVYCWRRAPASKLSPASKPSFRSVQLHVRSPAYADFAELRARVFGAQTTLDGLHSILRGGIVPRTNRGRVWLVHGRAGSGKSTLGLTLAADVARRRRVAIILCAEERTEVIRERLDVYGLRDEERYAVVGREALERDLAATRALLAASLPNASSREGTRRTCVAKGLLVVFGASSDSEGGAEDEKLELTKWLAELAQRTRGLCAELAARERRESDPDVKAELRSHHRKWRWISVVVDSVDTLDVEIPELRSGAQEASERASLRRLVRGFEQSRVWAVLLAGADHPRTLPLSYLADTVIELGSTDAGLQRYLQIVKCRTQAYDPGRHVLELVEGRGVALYPNLASVQRAALRRARRELDRERVIRMPHQIHWTSSAERHTGPSEAGPDAAADLRDARLPSIRRGSSVLLYGPPQSGKGPLLLNWMAERMKLATHPGWRLGATGAVLFVSFRSSGPEFLRPLEESKQLARKWSSNVADVQTLWYGVDETMSAAQVAHALVQRIERARRDGVPLDWIAFLGIEALGTNLPAVEAERSFWPTIFAITTSEEITTAFVVAGDDHRVVTHHRSDMDYVFRFMREAQSSERSIVIEKSPDPPEALGYPTLRLDLQHGTLSAAGPEVRQSVI